MELKKNSYGYVMHYFNKIWGSEVPGGQLIFEVARLMMFRGYLELRDLNDSTDCEGNPVSNNACRVEAKYSERIFCFRCRNMKRIIDGSKVYCSSSALSGYRERDSFYGNQDYDKCDVRKYVDSSGVCQPCSIPDCVHCSTATNCFGCDMNLNKAWSSSTNACYTCDVNAGKYVFSDHCSYCPYSGCPHCPSKRCSNVVCSDTQTYIHNKCCAVFHGYSVDGNCAQCQDSNCKACRGSSGQACGACYKGSAINLMERTCLANCDQYNGYFVDPDTRACTPCSQGCLKCSSKDYCISCDTFNQYTLKPDRSCSLCGVGVKGKYINSLSKNPPGCDDCLPNCDSCKDRVSCDTCKENYYWDGSGCVFCDSSQGFKINTLVTPHVCLTCHQTCKRETI